MLNSRTLAYQILLHLEQKASHPDRLIRAALERHSLLDERDRALLTELVYGVVRWQGRLDWHIDQLSKTKPEKIAPPVRLLLRMALYQILFLDRIPNHAAVNETVNIAKKSQPPHLVRFVNGILREAIRREATWDWPDSEKEPLAHLSITSAHPHWLVRKLAQEIGTEESRLFCEANNRVAPAVFRVNTLKSGSAEVIRAFHDEGIEALPSPWLQAAVRATALRQDITKTNLYLEGYIQAQDEASQLVSLLLAPEPGERVLDLCSGFGVKSTHLGVLMKNQGEILSVDNSAWKLEELLKNAARQGIGIISTRTEDVLKLAPESTGLFDRILLDAPCTGFGAIRRNPDIKWRRHIKDPYRMSQIQKQLLLQAATFLKENGILVYSTCTVLTEENEEVAGFLTTECPELRPEPVADFLPESCRHMASGLYLRSWPHQHDVDGFFAARWRKVSRRIP